MKRASAWLITAGIVLAGCGGTSASSSLAPVNVASLRADLASIRAASSAHEPAAAHAATARLRADIQRLLSTGALSAADGRPMLKAVAQADGRISVEVRAATAPPTAPAAPAPAPTPAAHGAHGPGHHGHGPGPKGGDGGD